MVPVIDYGNLAVVVSKVTAVGMIICDEGDYGFEVYLDGLHEPLIIGFQSEQDASLARAELIAAVAGFHHESVSGLSSDNELLSSGESGSDDGGQKNH